MLLWSPEVQAHAPLARAALIANDGAVYVYSSWFGVVLRTGTDTPFGYGCDAIFGMQRTARNPVWAARSDGAILLGNSQSPPRVVSANGCEWNVASTWPTDVGIAALGSEGSPDELVAVTYEDAPRLLRSQDGGDTWDLITQFEVGVPITAMHVTPRQDQAARIYLTRPSGSPGSALMISDDGGASFTTAVHGADLTLIDVRAGSPDELWFLSPRLESHDVAIVRGAANATTFEEVHRVRFFGGLALSRSDEKVWIADEAGSLVRSDNGGESFVPIQTDLAVACLVHQGGTLWACASGTPDQPALVSSIDNGATFTTEMTFGEVDHLLVCDASAAIEVQCASEWFDWERDVLPQPDAGIDASVNTDAGTPRKPRASGGCSVHPAQQRAHLGPGLYMALACAWMLRCRRGTKT